MLNNIKINSLRWKIIIIYLLLVFIATTIIGVFIVKELESYYEKSVTESIRAEITESEILSSYQDNRELKKYKEEINQKINYWNSIYSEDVFIIDKSMDVIASKNEMSQEKYNQTLLQKAFSGEHVNETEKEPYIKTIVEPIRSADGEIKGAVYVRVDMDILEDIISESKSILLTAMILALAITAILGYFISRSITQPINYVAEKSEKMLEGDFSQKIEVNSNDEIGHMAKVFDLIRIQLDSSLSEITSEKNKLETILRQMADGLMVVDLDGHITHVNQAARGLLKITDDDVKKKTFDEIMAHFNQLRLEEILLDCKDGAVESEFVYGGATYALRYDMYRDEEALDAGIILIVQDVTERQKMENMQKDFVANVSHELKTPLTTMKSYTETLIDNGINDQETTMSFLEIIDGEIDRMNRLVKDLLQLSRLNYKQQKWYKKEGNIIILIRNVALKMEVTAKSKNQHLNRLFDKNATILVDMDRDKIEQVMQNILSNAINYTDEGGRIDIEVIKQEKTVQIVVSDNGIGIPEEDLSRVFERFFRVDKARSRETGGTGLGLSISRQIIEDHKGTIGISSESGRGTKVTITLPLAPIRGQKGIL